MRFVTKRTFLLGFSHLDLGMEDVIQILHVGYCLIRDVDPAHRRVPEAERLCHLSEFR